jgi:molybdopterin synthase catalytic subunit
MTIVARLERSLLDPVEELKALAQQASGDGAIVTFTGLARGVSKIGNVVDGLVLEHHPSLTQQSLDQIAKSAVERFGVSQVRVIHRCGEISPGEPIVFAGAASVHRRAAFEAVDYLMDRLKTEAVFWKREVGAAGSEWIEPTEADYRDLERWS